MACLPKWLITADVLYQHACFLILAVRAVSNISVSEELAVEC